MTQKIVHKLRSQRGASLLLALLFLMICSLVAASILMAAAANAGKRRSNLEEHQTYLALSSAVSLLCDELNAAEYRGQYRYWEETDTITNADETTTTVTEYYFVQENGAYSSELSSILLDNFDALFAAQIEKDLAGRTFTQKDIKTTSVTAEYQLTIHPQTGTDLDDREVGVTLEVKDTYAMYLTATLDDYTIEAELTPNESKPKLPSFLANSGADTIQQTDPMQWKIGWITTGGEEDTP